MEDPANQISLEDALKIRSDYRMGDIAEIDVTPTGFLRTAAQTAKQVIMQRIREAEQGKIYDEYSEKENEILTAIVQRVEPKGVYVELGRTEGILPDSEWMPGEEYHIDDHIKVYVLEVNRTGREMLRGPQVRVSRIHPGLVKRLFEMEVPEIAAGVMQIKSIGTRGRPPYQDGRTLHRGDHRSRGRLRGPARQPRGKGRRRAEEREDRHHQVVAGPGGVYRQCAQSRARAERLCGGKRKGLPRGRA